MDYNPVDENPLISLKGCWFTPAALFFETDSRESPKEAG
jgi:hypothetical protein